MSVLAALQLVLLAGLLFALTAGLAVSALVPLALKLSDPWSPERRHRLLLVLSVTPVLVALAGLASVLAPSLLALVWPEYDHCLAHGDHHVHICAFHLPHDLGRWWSWLLLLLAVTWLGLRALSEGREVLRAARCVSQLRTFDAGEIEPGARVLGTELPLCLVTGILKPTILLSRGLLGQLSPEQVSVVLQHERAHAARHDLLRRLVAQLGTLLLVSWARTALLRALELSAERCCDELAAAHTGDRVRVAETILKVERALQSAQPALALTASFGGPSVPARVSALLEAPKPAGSPALLAATLTTLLLAVVAATESLHHLTESLLAVLTR
jgi:Zn-dependent protease with chaperone function